MPAKGKKSKKNLPPPPPPEIVYLSGEEEYKSTVLDHQGFCLVAVLAHYCSICSRTVMPYLEKLNSERLPALAALKIVVIYAGDDTSALCHSLKIITVPTFFTYSYGKVVNEFCGDNVERAQLMSLVAAQRAEEDKKALEAEAAAAAAAQAEAQEAEAPAVKPAEAQSPAAP